jgi:hypothetical protein
MMGFINAFNVSKLACPERDAFDAAFTAPQGGGGRSERLELE